MPQYLNQHWGIQVNHYTIATRLGINKNTYLKAKIAT